MGCFFIIIIVIMISSGCASKRHCDAYGDNLEQKINEDVQQNS